MEILFIFPSSHNLTDVFIRIVLSSYEMVFPIGFLFLLSFALGAPYLILVDLEAQKARRYSRKEQIFLNILEEICLALGEKKCEGWVYPSQAINAISLKTLRGNSFVVVSTRALEVLSRSQLQALVGQAVARCATEEATWNTLVCSLSYVCITPTEKDPEKLKQAKELCPPSFINRFWFYLPYFLEKGLLSIFWLIIKVSFGLFLGAFGIAVIGLFFGLDNLFVLPHLMYYALFTFGGLAVFFLFSSYFLFIFLCWILGHRWGNFFSPLVLFCLRI